MLYLGGLTGSVFIMIASLHVAHPVPLAWVPYAGAAVLALITLKREIADAVARGLAVITTAAMFFFFAGFFVVAPKLTADWFAHQEGWSAVCLLLCAFAMIPILSDYSCRLKADCTKAPAERRRAFFSVPGHIPPPR
jgi:hypothetical protein